MFVVAVLKNIESEIACHIKFLASFWKRSKWMNKSIFKTELTKLLIIMVCDRTSCMLIGIF